MRDMNLKKYFAPVLLVTAMGSSGMANAAVIGLYDYAMNIDGTLYEYQNGDTLPGSVNGSAFDFTTGIGNISVTLSGAGAHYIDFFVDHEIDEAANTWFNETGSANGVAVAGQSWEIDEPGYHEIDYWGDIYENVASSSLDNDVFYDGFSGDRLTDYGRNTDDVSMALGWDFSLDATQTAVINFLVSETMPTDGFYLTQFDPDSDSAIYFSSTLEKRGVGVPAPTSLLLLSLGLAGLAAYRKKVC